MKKRKTSILVEAAVLSISSAAQAGSNDTLSSWSGSGVGAFGKEFGGELCYCRRFGQTFKIPSGDAKLNSITFGFWDYAPLYAPKACKFEVYCKYVPNNWLPGLSD